MRKIHFFSLVLILLLATFLRFWHLGGYPPSFWQDICSIGDDAYSLLRTGRDHWGKPFPHLYLRSLGDYKLPLFTYFTIPGVALFGLNEFGVRFPSALFGTLTVLLTYFLVNELFITSAARRIPRGSVLGDEPPPEPKARVAQPRKKPTTSTAKEVWNSQETPSLRAGGGFINGLKRENKLVNPASPAGGLLTRNKLIALTASFLLAISPWHIGLVRHGYEAGLAVFSQALALFLFLKSKKRPLLLLLSSLFFALTTYTYHSSRVFTPLFFSGLILVFLKDFRKQKRMLYLSFFLFFVLIAPSLFSFFTPTGSTRLIANRFDKTAEWRQKLASCQIFCSEKPTFIFTFIRNYFSQFSFDFLFVFGSTDPVFERPSRGHFYFFEAFLFVFGLLALFKLGTQQKSLIFLWLCLYPLPSSITSNPYHPARTAQLIPLVEIVSALGFVEVLKFFWKKRIHKLAFLTIFFLVSFLSLGKYFVDYYATYPLYSHPTYQKIHKRLYGQLAGVEKDYSKIYITRRAQPYIYLLFFLPIEPEEFQKMDKELEAEGEREEAHFKRIGKFYFFRSLPEEIENDALMIASPYDFPEGFKPETLFEINDLRGNLVFFAFKAQQLKQT